MVTQIHKEEILFKSAELLSEITGRPTDELVDALRTLVASGPSAPVAAEAKETMLESFIGYVDRIDGETAYVRLTSREHGDVLYGQYSASELAARGIGEQARFLCETAKVGENTRLELKALPDLEVSQEELRAMEEEIDRALPRDDPGVEY